MPLEGGGKKKKEKQTKKQWRSTSQKACGSWVGLACIRWIGKWKACKALNIKDILVE